MNLRSAAYFLTGVALVFYVHERALDAQWDLTAYLRAAEALRAGQNPYPLPDEDQEIVMTNLTIYVYPPLLARVLSPFAGLPCQS